MERFFRFLTTGWTLYLAATLLTCLSWSVRCLRPLEGACDEALKPHVIDSFTAIVWSPYYPDDYPPNMDCEWLFVLDDAPEQETLFLAWNRFAVEACTDCSCDYVEIYDGANMSAPLLHRLCGGVGVSAVASGREMLMRFVSDSTEQLSGFQAQVTPVIPGCGISKPALIRSSEGQISSTNYPEPYPHNEDCGWLLEAPQGQRIELDLGSMDIENCCACDYVEVFDGPDPLHPLLGRWYADDVPPLLQSSGPHLYMEFTSDYSNSDPEHGFLAKYRHVF